MDSAWQLPRRRLSRRRLMRTAAFGGGAIATIAAVGCGGKKASSSAGGNTAAGTGTGTPTAKRGGTLVRSQTQRFDAILDPHPLQPVYTSVYSMWYQSLLNLNPRTAALEPLLAAKWEQPSPTEYVFHLQQGVKFHNKAPANGRLMTADDVVFSIKRVRTDDPRFQNRLLLSSIDQIDAVDKATVRITTKAPDVSILTNLAGFSVAILAPEVVEKAGKFADPDTAVGTGAFILQSMDETNADVVRNPEYWKKGLPYLDGIKTRVFSDPAPAAAAFQAGQIQVGANVLSGPDAKKAFDEQADKSFAAEWYKDISFTTVQANLQKKPFDDPRVTKALRLLIDHDEAVNSWAVTWFGRGYLTAYMPAALDSWDIPEQEYKTKYLEFKQPKDDAVKEALSMLAAAGFSKDKPLKFTLSGLSNSGFARAEAENHQAQLNKFGQGVVQVPALALSDLAVLNQLLAQGNFEYLSSNAVPAQPYDVDSWFTTLYHTGAGRNYGKYSDPKLDQMIDKQRTIFDVNQRKAAVQDILRYMMDNAPYTAWAARELLSLESRKVHGWAPEGVSTTWGNNYEQVWVE